MDNSLGEGGKGDGGGWQSLVVAGDVSRLPAATGLPLLLALNALLTACMVLADCSSLLRRAEPTACLAHPSVLCS